MLSINNLSLYYGQRALLEDIHLFIGKRDRLGLVGKNGTGKSSMLKIIAGSIPPGRGNIVKPKELTISYLPQEMAHKENQSVMQEASLALEEIKKIEQRIAFIFNELRSRDDFHSQGYIALIEELNELNDRLALMGIGQLEAKIERILSGLGFVSADMNRKLKEFSGGWKRRVELAKILLRNPDVMLLDEPTITSIWNP
jgi:ATP-binding cassette subfamily F protein 3